METVSFAHMALSSSLAACTAEVLTLPIDTAKVRLQVTPRGVSTGGLVTVLVKMMKEEGIAAWWKGLPAGLHRQAIYATLRMSMYPHIRDFYGKQLNYSASSTPPLFLKILAGMSSGVIGMTIANPTDVVKVRLQAAITSGANASVGSSSHTVYTGALHAYSSIVREEGILGLWRGWGPNITRNAIVCASEMVAYDELKRYCIRILPDGFVCHCVAGFGAGFIATVTGSPIDVIKTRYMNARPGKYRGVFDCFRNLIVDSGPRALYVGFVPNVLRVGSFNMLVFVFYEQILRHLGATNVAKSIGDNERSVGSRSMLLRRKVMPASTNPVTEDA